MQVLFIFWGIKSTATLTCFVFAQAINILQGKVGFSVLYFLKVKIFHIHQVLSITTITYVRIIALVWIIIVLSA